METNQPIPGSELDMNSNIRGSNYFIAEDLPGDYLNYFDNKRIKLSGVNAGEYLDKEDFETYGKWVASLNKSLYNRIGELLADNERLKVANSELLEALKEMVSEFETFVNIPNNLKDLPGYTGENTRDTAVIKAHELITKHTKQ